jgi:futalosine hydrolase
LIGIAGSLSDDLQIGTATTFGSVACYGIGAGSGSTFQTTSEMGWDDAAELALVGAHTAIQLISCTSASASPFEAEQKLLKFRKGIAEDMEGYAVALACSTFNIPVRIVRGISNRAGDRDHQHWEVKQAMIAAELLANSILAP